MMKHWIAAGLIAGLSLGGAPVVAQQSDTAPAKVVGPQAYGPAAPAKRCNPNERGRNGEIVVCGKSDDAEFRVKSSAENDADSREANDDGQLHAPDFGTSCKKNPEKGPCIKFGSTPEPAYMIKFEDLPDTPEGSDADKIAKGEKKAD